MYKMTGIDVKNNKYKVLDTGSNIESICTREQLIQSKDMGFKVLGVLQDWQIVVWDTFYKLSLLSDKGKKNLMKILNDYSVVVITDDGIINKELTGNCVVLNISNHTDIEDMFRKCKAASLDLSGFDTSKITNMSMMFWECSLMSLNLSGFDTSNVTDMGRMFKECSVANLDLRNFDTSKVTDMSRMFCKCKVLDLDLSSFNTSKVTDMGSMFERCSAKSLDLSSFDTSKVTNMGYMFYDCETESLDLRNFDTSGVIIVHYMFSGYLGNEIILRKSQKRLIEQAKKDGQEAKLCIR